MTFCRYRAIIHDNDTLQGTVPYQLFFLKTTVSSSKKMITSRTIIDVYPKEVVHQIRIINVCTIFMK